MVTVIKKGASKKDLDKALSKIEKVKKFDTHKYCGVINLKEDPIEIQKKMRDEWG